MRPKLSILLALPAANALSLANFQSISLASIPLVCQLTYDQQIPSCTVADFNTGCTPACVAGLNAIAADVISACEGTHVTSNSLLGIIQGGGIQGALCPTLAKTTTTAAKTTSAAQISTVSAALSVTIPTDSVGVTGGLGFQTSSSTTAKTTSAKTTSTTRASTTTPVIIKSTSNTLQSSTAAVTSLTSTDTTESTTEASQTTLATSTSSKSSGITSSATAQTTTKVQSNTDKSGGGSPFDISSSADRIGGSSVLGFVILSAWTGLLLVR